MQHVTLRMTRRVLMLSTAFALAGCAVGAERDLAGASAVWQQSSTLTSVDDELPPDYPRQRGTGSAARRAYRAALDAWLAPPPPDQPQPRFHGDRPEYDAEPVWHDRQAVFNWKIVNTGAAPLRLCVET